MKTYIRYLLSAAVVCIFSVMFLPSSRAWHSGDQQTLISAPSLDTSPGGDQPEADIGVNKTATPDEVNPGEDITYMIAVTSGQDPAENATLNDQLPPSLTFVSLSAPAGWNCTTPMGGASGTVSCTNPSLAPTAGDLFTLVVHVPTDAAPGTFFSNTATVSTTTFDPNDENNSSTAATLVAGNSADMTLTKTAGSDEAAPGFAINYTIQVINNGPDAASNATLNDILPDSVTFSSLSQPAGWTCMTPAVGQGGTVSCSRPSLPVTSGDTFTLSVVVRPDTPVDTVVTNMATVSTSTPEGTDENNSDSASVTVVPRSPTAANGEVNGRVLDDHGNPVAGVVLQLSGTNLRKTITDTNGNYHFGGIETNGFYTVMPSRANYSFSPASRSFSQLGNNTEAIFAGTLRGDITNPLDTAEYFVRQQYVDILGREPDEAGFNYWSDHILGCGGDAACTRAERTGVASAFFIENEFRQSGAFIYNLYKGALGRRPAYAEYSADRRNVVGGATLEAQKQAFAEAFVARAEFANRYQNNTTAESFVDALLANVHSASGVDLASQRASLINRYAAGTSQTDSRTLVLRDVTESAAVRDANYNGAFVAVEYFGYLHRDPDQQGYDFWLSVLNDTGRNGDPASYRGMVCSFITSAEYQRRFSAVVSHTNSDCGGQ